MFYITNIDVGFSFVLLFTLRTNSLQWRLLDWEFEGSNPWGLSCIAVLLY